MRHILAIDIGNSKTEYIVGNEEGLILGQFKGEGANYQAKGWDTVLGILTRGVSETLKETDIAIESLSYAYIGAAGADSEEDYSNLDALFKKLLGKVPYSFENDGMISLKNGIVDKPGLVITCGTGNVNCGQNREGKILRLGGYCLELGDILGSETIAKYIARDSARSFDHRDYGSILPGLIVKKLNLRDIFELMEMNLESEIATEIIAVFLEACELFDGKALELCWTFTKEVLTIVEYFHKNLFMTEDKFRLVLDGYIFNTDNPFVKMIKNSLIPRYPLEIIFPETPPVFGAYYYALEGINTRITNDKIQRLKESYIREAGK